MYVCLTYCSLLSMHFYACVCTLFGRERDVDREREKGIHTMIDSHVHVFIPNVRSPFLMPYRWSTTSMMTLTLQPSFGDRFLTDGSACSGGTGQYQYTACVRLPAYISLVWERERCR